MPVQQCPGTGDPLFLLVGDWGVPGCWAPTAPLHLQGTGGKSPSFSTHLSPTVSLSGTPSPLGQSQGGSWAQCSQGPEEDEDPVGAKVVCPTL